MNNSNWRIPDEKERKIALYWIKRNSNGNISFPMGCFLFLLTGVIAFLVASYFFAPENLAKVGPFILIFGFFLSFIGWFSIYNLITEIQKVRLVSKGDFKIIDAKVQFVGRKRMSKYSYMNVVEASYHSGFGAKPTTFSVSRAIKKKTKAGDIGYVISFPNGNSWTKKSLVFIPKNM